MDRYLELIFEDRRRLGATSREAKRSRQSDSLIPSRLQSHFWIAGKELCATPAGRNDNLIHAHQGLGGGSVMLVWRAGLGAATSRC